MAPTSPETSTTSPTTHVRTRVGPIALLVVTSALLLMDTSLISLLIEPIRRDLDFSDAELGLLQGALPTVAYALCALPIGLLVDRFNRSRMILIALILWTGALLLIAIAPNFAVLAIAKVLIGAVQAVLVTAPFSLIADLSSRPRRSAAVSTLVVGQTLGAGLGFILGGVIFAALSTIPDVVPWRLTMLVFAVPSLILIPCYLVFREPARTERGTDASGVRVILGELRTRSRTLWPLFVGYAFVMVAGSALTVWTAPAFIRLYALSELEVGGIVGVLTLAGGIAGAVLAGWLIERARRRGRNGVVAIVFGAIALSAATAFALMPTVGAAVALLAVGMIAIGVIGTSVTAFLMLYLPNELRGLAGGTLILLAIGPGLSVGPSLIAFTSELLGGEQSLGEAMALVGIPAGLVAAGLFALLAGLTRRDAAYRQAPSASVDPDVPTAASV